MLVKIRISIVKFFERYLPFIYKFFKNLKKSISNYIAKRRERIEFKRDFDQFMKLTSYSETSKNRFKVGWFNRWPIMNEKAITHDFDRHYVFFIAWAVRKVKKINPKLHIDMSSSLHFCTTLSAFIPVKFYDYRRVDLSLDNLETGAADLTDLKDFEDESVESISCMHVVEHIGLGRYGDPIDPDGDIKAINELKRVLAKNGNLLFVVPMGQAEIRYNAHRLYSYSQIIEYFSDMKLVEFALIPDEEEQGQLITNASKEMADKQTYACGCFWFSKQ